MVIIRSPRLRVKLRLPWLRNETDGPDFQLRAEDAQALLDGSGRVERDVLRGRQLRDRLEARAECVEDGESPVRDGGRPRTLRQADAAHLGGGAAFDEP